MAKTATRKSKRTKAVGAAKPRASGSRGRSSRPTRSSSGAGAGDAFTKLLQSPLVADLVAVAATAALAALAEHGFSSHGDSSGSKRAGKAVKEAGRAAAAAIGRRLSAEIDEIRKASAKDGEGAKS